MAAMRRRSRLVRPVHPRLVLVVGLVLLGLAAALGPAPVAVDSPPPSAAQGKPPVVFVAPFENRAPGPRLPFRISDLDFFASYTLAAHDNLEDLLVNRGVALVDRSRIGALLKTSGIKAGTGMSDAEAVMATGKQLGADIVVTGSLLSVGHENEEVAAYGVGSRKATVRAQLQIRAVDVATGRILLSRQVASETKLASTSIGHVEATDMITNATKEAIGRLDDREFLEPLGGKAQAPKPAAAPGAAAAPVGPVAGPAGAPVVFIPDFDLSDDSPRDYYGPPNPSKALAKAGREMLEDILINRRIKIVERKQTQSMVAEGEFARRSVTMDDATAVKLGKGVGATHLVHCTVVGAPQTSARTTSSSSSSSSSRSEITTVKVDLRVRVIDLTTGQVTYSQMHSGQAGTADRSERNNSSFGASRTASHNDLAQRALKDALTKAMLPKFIAALSSADGRRGADKPAVNAPDDAQSIEITFEPTPAKCDLLIDGQYRGSTPMTLRFPTEKAVRVVLRKAGFQPWEATLTPSDKTPGRIEPELAPGAPAASPYTPPPGSTRVDLLGLIDPVRDPVKGAWRLSGGKLEGDPGEQSRIEFAYTPPAEYDLRVAFSRQRGNGEIACILVAGEAQFAWVVGALQNQAAGFELFDGKRAHENPSTKRNPDGWLKSGLRQVLTIKVRKNRLEGWLDDQLLSTLDADLPKLRLRDVSLLHQAVTLGLASDRNALSVESVELFSIGAPGRRAR